MDMNVNGFDALYGVRREFESVKDLVRFTLQTKPETRDDDIRLYIECCKQLGASDIDDIVRIGANPQTIVRARKLVQNVEGKFPPTEKVLSARVKRSRLIREYLRGIN